MFHRDNIFPRASVVHPDLYGYARYVASYAQGLDALSSWIFKALRVDPCQVTYKWEATYFTSVSLNGGFIDSGRL